MFDIGPRPRFDSVSNFVQRKQPSIETDAFRETRIGGAVISIHNAVPKMSDTGEIERRVADTHVLEINHASQGIGLRIDQNVLAYKVAV